MIRIKIRIRRDWGRIGEDVSFGAEGFEELAGGEVPAAEVPGVVLPADTGGEVELVLGIDERIVLDARGDEACAGFGAALVGQDEFIEVPLVADAAGIGGGINARAPV